jgi:hypothetical protein
MEVKITKEYLIIEHDGLEIKIYQNDKFGDILDYVSIKVDCKDIIDEIENEIDMLPCEVVSGRFLTGAYYGLNNNNVEVFISRETVAFCPDIFDALRGDVKLPFYAIINRYTLNSTTKKRQQFARVFAKEDEMLKVYRNTINYLKFKSI